MEAVVTNDVSRPPATCTGSCPRHAAKRHLLAAAGWLAAAGAALSVSAVPYDAGESLCGLWGCYPPLPAVAAMHLFWLVACGAGVWVVRTSRPALLVPLGLIVSVAAAAGAAVVIGRDVSHWLAWVPLEYHHLWPRRVAYAVFTRTDVPFAQSLLTGLGCVVLGRTCRVTGRTPSVTPWAE